MPWHVCRTIGRETRASFYLSRAGIRNFRPVEHHYFIDRRTKAERYRERPRFGGYVFVELHNAAERDAASRAIGVAGLLGWKTDSGYKLAEIPTHYVTDLMDAGPKEFNKRNSNPHCPFQKGNKVNFIDDRMKAFLAEFEGVDDEGKGVITFHMFGKGFTTKVELERLQAAE